MRAMPTHTTDRLDMLKAYYRAFYNLPNERVDIVDAADVDSDFYDETENSAEKGGE